MLEDILLKGPVELDEAVETPEIGSLLENEGQLADAVAQFLQSAGNWPLKYSLERIARVLWLLVEPPDWFLLIFESSIPTSQKLTVIRSIEPLFAELFAPYCEDVMSSEYVKQSGPLNQICYMWWDLFPFPKAAWPDSEVLNAEITILFEKLLYLPGQPVQESILHGLSHFPEISRGRKTAVIDAFLARKKDLSPGIREYALEVLAGEVA